MLPFNQKLLIMIMRG